MVGLGMTIINHCGIDASVYEYIQGQDCGVG